MKNTKNNKYRIGTVEWDEKNAEKKELNEIHTTSQKNRK